MKAKTLIELLTLSTNLYMISKDEKFMSNLNEMKEKGKEKLHEFLETDDESEDLSEKILNKAKQAKAEIEHLIEEVVKKLYEKMQIAHLEKISDLHEQLESLKKELALAESRIVHLESLKQ